MTPDLTTPYNYDRFNPRTFNFGVYAGPKAGDCLPDLNLMSLNGNAVDLEAFRGYKLVIETGSLTCPMFMKNIHKMNALAKEYPDVAFIMIYVREAHPGERLKGHRSLEQKLSCAKTLLASEPEQRKVFVDTLQGDAHSQLGLLPNLLYVVNEAGRVVLRSSWNDPKLVASFLAGTLPAEELALDVRKPPNPNLYTLGKVTLRGGVLSLWDLLRGLPRLLLMQRRSASST